MVLINSKEDFTGLKIANYFNVDFKSSFRRLKELEKLGLVKRREDKVWKKKNTGKKVVVI